jgi:hypothetical protein
MLIDRQKCLSLSLTPLSLRNSKPPEPPGVLILADYSLENSPCPRHQFLRMALAKMVSLSIATRQLWPMVAPLLLHPLASLKAAFEWQQNSVLSTLFRLFFDISFYKAWPFAASHIWRNAYHPTNTVHHACIIASSRHTDDIPTRSSIDYVSHTLAPSNIFRVLQPCIACRPTTGILRTWSGVMALMGALLFRRSISIHALHCKHFLSLLLLLLGGKLL